MKDEFMRNSFSPLTCPAVIVRLSRKHPPSSGAFNCRLSNEMRPFMSSMDLPVKSAVRSSEILAFSYLSDRWRSWGRRFFTDAFRLKSGIVLATLKLPSIWTEPFASSMDKRPLKPPSLYTPSNMIFSYWYWLYSKEDMIPLMYDSGYRFL